MPFFIGYFLTMKTNKKSERKECRRKQYSKQQSQILLKISETYQKYLNRSRTKMACAPFLQRKPGSLTVEAALVVPIMILLMYGLIYPVRIMGVDRRIQNNMEQAAKRIAIADYIVETGTERLQWKVGPEAAGVVGSTKDMEDAAGPEGAEDVEDAAGAGGTAGTVSTEDTRDQIANVIESGIGAADVLLNIDPKDRKLLWNYAMDPVGVLSEDEKDPDMIRMVFYYYLDIPGLPHTFWSLFHPMQIVTNRRAWVGADGGRGKEEYSEESAEESEEDPWVYLGKTSSEVYHLTAGCHYLSNTMLSVDASAISFLRNSNGSRYYPCSSCRPESSGTVYYFRSGNAYHSSQSCKAITSYVQKKHLSEVSGMRACSYCGRKAAA